MTDSTSHGQRDVREDTHFLLLVKEVMKHQVMPFGLNCYFFPSFNIQREREWFPFQGFFFFRSSHRTRTHIGPCDLSNFGLDDMRWREGYTEQFLYVISVPPPLSFILHPHPSFSLFRLLSLSSYSLTVKYPFTFPARSMFSPLSHMKRREIYSSCTQLKKRTHVEGSPISPSLTCSL